MNFEQEQLAYDEIEINILLVLKKCVQNVKWIIICAVVSAVAISSLTYLKSMKEYEKKNSEFIVEELTEEELEAVERYYLLNEKVEQLQTYKDNSPIMQMDCNDVYQYTINYYISGNEREDVAVAIERYISSKRFGDEFTKHINNIDATYVGEVVTCLTAEVDSGVISVRVLAINEYEVQNYVDIVKSIVSLYSDELQEDIGGHKLEILYEEMTHGYLEQVHSVQNGNYSNISSAETALSNYFGTLSIKEKNYIAQRNGEAIEYVVSTPVFQMKYVVLGVGIGAIVCILIIVIQNLLNGKLHSQKEIMKRFQIIYYGLFSKDITKEPLEKIVACIVKSCENEGSKKVAIISTLDNLSLEDINCLVRELAKNNIQCNILGNVLEDKDAVGALSKNIPIILIEKVEETKVKELYDEIVFCNNMKTKVIGYICIN